MKPTLVKNLFAAALGLVAMLGVNSAQAIVYTGSWDPAYGAAFPDLGWRGDITFTVDASCMLTASAYNPCASALAHVDAVTVEFYELATPATTLESFNFGPLSATLKGVYLDAGMNVIGLKTESFAPFNPSLTLDGLNNFDFYLSFVQSGALLVHVAAGDTLAECVTGGTVCGYSDPSSETAGPGVFLHITPVPEPGSYALFAAGMLGLWLARRRHQP